MDKSENKPSNKQKRINNIKEKIAKILPYKTLPNDKKEIFQIWDKRIKDEIFRRYLLDIIDGKHSSTLWWDKVIIEEKLNPWELFKEFCKRGLADIRIIVFNLVPVATMIRVPTKYSWWKANLAQWWLGLWIDIATWKVNSMLRKNKVYTRKFPKEFEHFFGKEIPYRKDILFLSSKTQYYVNLWYLALDRVITNEWPKLLEINARAGLEVQKVTNTPLKKTLKKIEDLKIRDPEKWVEIAQTLFSKTASHTGTMQKILYLSQYWKLTFKQESENKIEDVIVEVNLNRQNNYISSTLHKKIKQNSNFFLDLFNNDIILKKIKFIEKEELEENKIILWRKISEKYLIKAVHKVIDKVEVISPEKIIPAEIKKLHTIDNQIEKISKRLNLAARLRPLNYFNELDNFITRKWNYNPVFQYKRPKTKTFNEIQDNLKKIENRTNKIESPMRQLFLDKIDELHNRFFLIKWYIDQNLENIDIYNKKIFWDFDEDLLIKSKEKVFSPNESSQELLGKALKLSEIEQLIDRYLAEKKIFGVDVVFSYHNLSRISIIMWKETRISISKHWVFREKEILSVLAHEVDTHLVRYLNGEKSDRNILKSWTWYYLKDEEGFAIYNANQHLPEWYEKDSIYKKYYLSNEWSKLDFKKLYDLISFVYPYWSVEQKFKTVIRIKKWLIHTSTNGIWTSFLKDKIYLDWLEKIQNAISSWIEINNLYKGKIKIEDLDYII